VLGMLWGWGARESLRVVRKSVAGAVKCWRGEGERGGEEDEVVKKAEEGTGNAELAAAGRDQEGQQCAHSPRRAWRRARSSGSSGGSNRSKHARNTARHTCRGAALAMQVARRRSRRRRSIICDRRRPWRVADSNAPPALRVHPVSRLRPNAPCGLQRGRPAQGPLLPLGLAPRARTMLQGA